MENIWAPWRIEYIENLKEKHEEDCIFCTKSKENKDDKNYILERWKSCFVIMNLYPYVGGHLMIAPYRHIGLLDDLSDEETLEMGHLLKKSSRALKQTMKPDGFNVGMNVGKAAGAGVDSHLHAHLVPRWERDTNFMPVINDIKVISESLDKIYAKLKPLFK